MFCPECGGRMKIIAFITDYSVVDRITNHLKLRFRWSARFLRSEGF
jgi:transposase